MRLSKMLADLESKILPYPEQYSLERLRQTAFKVFDGDFKKIKSTYECLLKITSFYDLINADLLFEKIYNATKEAPASIFPMFSGYDELYEILETYKVPFEFCECDLEDTKDCIVDLIFEKRGNNLKLERLFKDLSIIERVAEYMAVVTSLQDTGKIVFDKRNSYTQYFTAKKIFRLLGVKFGKVPVIIYNNRKVNSENLHR